MPYFYCLSAKNKQKYNKISSQIFINRIKIIIVRQFFDSIINRKNPSISDQFDVNLKNEKSWAAYLCNVGSVNYLKQLICR